MGGHTSKSKKYTRQEIIANGYIIAHGRVYNPQSFMEKHVAGAELIRKQLGKDCTHHYDMHRKSGKKEWEKCYIGKLSS